MGGDRPAEKPKKENEQPDEPTRAQIEVGPPEQTGSKKDDANGKGAADSRGASNGTGATERKDATEAPKPPGSSGPSPMEAAAIQGQTATRQRTRSVPGLFPTADDLLPPAGDAGTAKPPASSTPDRTHAGGRVEVSRDPDGHVVAHERDKDLDFTTMRERIGALQEGIKQRRFASAAITIDGKASSEMIKWATENAKAVAPDVHILYTTDLPSGQKYTFALKQPENGKSATFTNDWAAYTADDKAVVKGIYISMRDHTIGDALHTDQSHASSWARLRQKTMNEQVNYFNPRGATSPEVTPESIADMIRWNQDHLRQNPALATYRSAEVLNAPHNVQNVIDRTINWVNQIRQAEQERATSEGPLVRERRAAQGYKGRPDGYSLDVEHIAMDAEYEENKRPGVPGKSYNREFKTVPELLQELNSSDRSTVDIRIFDHVSGRTIKHDDVPNDRLPGLRVQVLKDNIDRALDLIQKREQRYEELKTKKDLAPGEAKEFAFLEQRHQDTVKNQAAIKELEARRTELAQTLKQFNNNSDPSDGSRATKASELNAAEARALKLQPKLVDALGGKNEWVSIISSIDPPNADVVKMVYVVTADGKLPAAPVISKDNPDGRPSHSELAQGKNIYGGGELVFRRDPETNKFYLAENNNGTWHYRVPGAETLPYANNLLQAAGVDTSRSKDVDALGLNQYTTEQAYRFAMEQYRASGLENSKFAQELQEQRKKVIVDSFTSGDSRTKMFGNWYHNLSDDEKATFFEKLEANHKSIGEDVPAKEAMANALFKTFQQIDHERPTDKLKSQELGAKVDAPAHEMEKYKADMKNGMKAKLEAVVPWVVNKPNAVTVDLGCADGVMLQSLSQQFGDHQLVGLDYSTQMVRDATHARYANNNVRIVQGDSGNLKQWFAPGSVDNLIASAHVHELYSYNGYNEGLLHNFLKESYDALAPGGRLIIRDFVKPQGRDVWMQLDKETADRFQTFVKDYKGKPHLKWEDIPKETNASGHTMYKVDLGYINEFISHKDYVESWNVEQHEQYAPWDKPRWVSEAESAGFQVRRASSWLNDHTITASYEGHVKLFAMDDKGAASYEVPFPDRTMVLVLEKPGTATPGAGAKPIEGRSAEPKPAESKPVQRTEEPQEDTAVREERNRGLPESERKAIAKEAETYQAQRRESTSGPRGLVKAVMHDIDPKLGQHFQAHGIVRGDEERQLRNLDALLTKGIDANRRFNNTPLRSPDSGNIGFRPSTPFLDGGFVVLSGPNQDIVKDGIKIVLVNDNFADSIPKLQKAYPNVEFIRADEANEKLTRIVAGESRGSERVPIAAGQDGAKAGRLTAEAAQELKLEMQKRDLTTYLSNDEMAASDKPIHTLSSRGTKEEALAAVSKLASDTQREYLFHWQGLDVLVKPGDNAEQINHALQEAGNSSGGSAAKPVGTEAAAATDGAVKPPATQAEEANRAIESTLKQMGDAADPPPSAVPTVQDTLKQLASAADRATAAERAVHPPASAEEAARRALERTLHDAPNIVTRSQSRRTQDGGYPMQKITIQLGRDTLHIDAVEVVDDKVYLRSATDGVRYSADPWLELVQESLAATASGASPDQARAAQTALDKMQGSVESRVSIVQALALNYEQNTRALSAAASSSALPMGGVSAMQAGSELASSAVLDRSRSRSGRRQVADMTVNIASGQADIRASNGSGFEVAVAGTQGRPVEVGREEDRRADLDAMRHRIIEDERATADQKAAALRAVEMAAVNPEAREVVARAAKEAGRHEGLKGAEGHVAGVGIVVLTLAGWYTMYRMNRVQDSYIPAAIVN